MVCRIELDFIDAFAELIPVDQPGQTMRPINERASIVYWPCRVCSCLAKRWLRFREAWQSPRELQSRL
jgi:hypothetical protein